MPPLEPPMPRLSIVIPLFNEEDVFEQLTSTLEAALRQEGTLEYEIILVDDGSHDATRDLIDHQVKKDARYRGIIFSRNFGHQAAVSAGLQASRGEVVLIMDADLQDPPAAGLELVRRVQAGAEVAYGVRRNRKEGPAKRIAYWTFYRLLRASSSLEIPLDAGDFAAMSRRVVNHINALPEHQRFVRGLRSYVGFTQEAVEYDRQARAAGEPKYDLGRLLNLATSGLLGFSDAPLKLGFIASAIFMVFGIGMGVTAIALAASGASSVAWWLAALLSAGISAITFILGIIGAYVARIHNESLGRPTYIVSERLGTGTSETHATASSATETITTQ